MIDMFLEFLVMAWNVKCVDAIQIVRRFEHKNFTDFITIKSMYSASYTEKSGNGVFFLQIRKIIDGTRKLDLKISVFCYFTRKIID